MKDKHTSACIVCARSFGLKRWKHTCVRCGQKVCDDCAPKVSHPDGRSACTNNGDGDGKSRICSKCVAKCGVGATVSSLDSHAHSTRSIAKAGVRASSTVDSRYSSQSEGDGRKLGHADSTSSVSAGHVASGNPVLEAALRRQKNNMLRGQNSIGDTSPSATSAAKLQLLRDIDIILAKHNETAPLGLRLSDEVKLRSYLLYLREKYNAR